MEAKQTLELFLNHAIHCNVNKAKKYVQITQKYSSNLIKPNIERINLELKGGGKIKIEELQSGDQNTIPTECVQDFKIETEKKGGFKIRLIRESGVRKPDPSGTWGVNVNSFKKIDNLAV